MADHHRKNMLSAFPKLLDAMYEYIKFEPLSDEEVETATEIRMVVDECDRRMKDLAFTVAKRPRPSIEKTNRAMTKWSWEQQDNLVMRKREQRKAAVAADPIAKAKATVEELERQLRLLDDE